MRAKRHLVPGVWVVPALLWIVLGQATAQDDWSAQSGALIVMLSGRIGQSPTFGAGIIIGREKGRLYIATANHVVRRGGVEATDLQIQIKLKALPTRALKAKLLPQANRELDLAVISVEHLAGSGVDVCAFSLDRLSEPGAAKRGDAVYPVGNPNGVAWVTPVRPDAIADITGDTISFQSAFMARGHSGGGLFDAGGQLIGMIEADEPPYGRALDIYKILEILKGWNYPVQLRVPAPDGSPALLNAVRQGDLDGAKRLLREACTDVNAKTNTDALVRDALQDRIDTKSVYRGTALHEATRRGQLAMVKLLIEAGAHVNQLDVGDSPLWLAAQSGDAQVVRLLIAHGAEVNQKNRARFFSLDFADQEGNLETALHAAAEIAALEVVKLLLAHGADPNAVNYWYRTPLFVATRKAAYAPDYTNRTPLALLEAAAQQREAAWDEIARSLIQAGAKVNWKDRGGETPLLGAVENERAGAVRILLEAGADVDIKNRDGDSPFRLVTRRTYANSTSQREIAALLVKFSSKIGSEDGSLLLQKCAKEGWAEVADLLVKRDVDTNPAQRSTMP